MTALVRFPTGGALPPPSNDENATPKLPRIVSWRAAMAWLAKQPFARRKSTKARRELLLDFYVFWTTDGLQDSKAWELRQDMAELLRNGCKPARPSDFERECKERMEDDVHATDPDDLFDLRGELESFFFDSDEEDAE